MDLCIRKSQTCRDMISAVMMILIVKIVLLNMVMLQEVKPILKAVDLRGLVKEEYLMIIAGYFFLFLHKTYVVDIRKKHLREGTSNEYYNIHFYGELKKIIQELFSNTPPSSLAW